MMIMLAIVALLVVIMIISTRNAEFLCISRDIVKYSFALDSEGIIFLKFGNQASNMLQEKINAPEIVTDYLQEKLFTLN